MKLGGHSFPAQASVCVRHTHAPIEHVRSTGHMPQLMTPQSGPRTTVPHCALPQASSRVLHRQRPASQTCPLPQAPHWTVPPQPSGSVPHIAVVHIVRGTHLHLWVALSQTNGGSQWPQSRGGLPQPASSVPHSKPRSHIVFGTQLSTHW